MKDIVLELKNLDKSYKKTEVLKNINLSIGRGEIYGLIGANGAGKTTIIKLITNQVFKSSGDIILFGKSTDKELSIARKKLGSIVETPSFYPHFSAKENLEYYRIQRGIKDKNCVASALEEVGLSDTGNKKFKNFSLGMKQRLGLALCIMSEPELLLLDEPINGLDPIGVMDFRNLLLKLNRERNITILISSHILSELENLATSYGFISKGRLIEEISANELHSKCTKYLELKVNSIDKVVEILENDFKIATYEVLKDNLIRIYASLNNDELFKRLIESNISVYSMNNKTENLEDYYLELVGGN